MNNKTHRVAAFLILSCLIARETRSEITKTINYQGFLIDKTTLQPVDAAKDMKFVLCDSQSAACGSPLFSETRCNLQVSKGRFDVEIGSATAGGIPASVFENNAAVWLERQVDPDDDCAGSFEALSPRMRLQAAAYAYQTLHADTATITMDVATATLAGTYDFTNSNSSFTATTYDAGVFSYTKEGLSRTQDIVHAAAWPLKFIAPTSGAGIEGSSVTLQAGGGNNGGGASAFNGGHVTIRAGDGSTSPGGSIYLLPGSGSTNGNVGIGTTAPAQKLHVSGGGLRISTATSEGLPALFINPANGQIGLGHDAPIYILHAKGVSPTIAAEATSTGQDVWSYYMQAGSLVAAVGYRDSNAGLTFFAGAGDKMVIKSGGNVGIATMNPAAVLDVNGDAQFGSGAAKSTFTATADLYMGASLGLSSRSKAQLQAATPARTGLLYFCSDCLNSVNTVISTGTVVGQFATAGNGAVAWQ